MSAELASRPTRVGALAGVAQFPHFENTAGLRASWAPSKWSYQAGYSHYNFISDNSGSSGADFSRLDRSSEQVFARVAYSIAPATRVGLEASSALTDYAAAAQPDNVSFSIGPYTEWQVNEAFTLSLRGGFTHYSFDSTPGAVPDSAIVLLRPAAEAYELSTYYAGVTINHRLTEFITHGVSASHSVQPGINQGSDFTESTDAGYQVSWALTRNSTIGASFGYAHGTETQTGIPDESPGPIQIEDLTPTDEAYDSYNLGVNGSYRLSQQTTVTLAYYHNRRESSNAGRSYFQNRISIGLRYQF